MEVNIPQKTSQLPCDYNQSLNASESLRDSMQNPIHLFCVFIYEGCITPQNIHSHGPLLKDMQKKLIHLAAVRARWRSG